MSSVDLERLEALSNPSVLLVDTQAVAGSASAATSGFADAASVYVKVIARKRSSRGVTPSLVVTVEHSDDGVSWSSAASAVAFAVSGSETVLVDAPKDFLRLVWASVGSWSVTGVASPLLSAPAGGGSLPGTVLPVAASSGVTVDTTTYDDRAKGSGKLTTLVFPSLQGVFAFAVAGDPHPRVIVGSVPGDYAVALGTGLIDPTNGILVDISGTGTLRFNNNLVGAAYKFDAPVEVGPATNSYQAPSLRQVSPRFTITSGALPTTQLDSGAGVQFDPSRDIEAVTPVTFNPGVATTATCTVALSPDNITYSTLAVVTKPVGVAFDGTIDALHARVPAGWYLKLTVNAQAVLGLTTYY